MGSDHPDAGRQKHESATQIARAEELISRRGLRATADPFAAIQIKDFVECCRIWRKPSHASTTCLHRRRSGPAIKAPYRSSRLQEAACLRRLIQLLANFVRARFRRLVEFDYGDGLRPARQKSTISSRLGPDEEAHSIINRGWQKRAVAACTIFAVPSTSQGANSPAAIPSSMTLP